MYEGVFLCGCYECVLLMPSKAFGGRRKGSTISTKRQELASLPIMTSPPQKEGQVVLSQSGRKEEEESGRVERERGSEESAAICGNKREFLI